MDILDIMAGHYFDTFMGKYYNKRPHSKTIQSQADSYDTIIPQGFDYEIADEARLVQRGLIANLNANSYAGITVSTTTPLDYKVGGCVTLYDGKMYIISEIIIDTSSVSREAKRLLPIPPGKSYVLRLNEIDNIREL